MGTQALVDQSACLPHVGVHSPLPGGEMGLEIGAQLGKPGGAQTRAVAHADILDSSDGTEELYPG